MKLPPRYISGNLVWGSDGSTWAVYRVDGRSYPWLPLAEKESFHGNVRALLRGLPQDSLLLSPCLRLNPTEVVEGMLARGQGPEWRALCKRALDGLSNHPSFTRRFFVAMKLPDRRLSRKQILAGTRVAMDRALGRPIPRPTWRELESAHDHAKTLLSQVSTSLALAPAEAEEVAWLYARSVLRGTEAEPGLGDASGSMPVVDELELRAIGSARWHEGGIPAGAERDEGRRGWHYLRVERNGQVSYQAFLTLARMPHRWLHMGASSEWFLRVEELGFQVDWAVRIESVPNSEARRTAQKKRRQLNDQVDEQAVDDDDFGEGISQDLGQAIVGAKIEQARLIAYENDPELNAGIVFCVYGSGLAEVERSADSLTAALGNREHALERPIGHQADCFTAMLPAGNAKVVMRDYRQVLLPIDLAGGVPFADMGLGDSSGLLFGFLADSAKIRLVMLDPEEGHRIGGSGSAGFFGVQGCGKSHTMKKLLKAVMAKGGKGVVFDITKTQEWRRAIQAMAGDWQVVELTVDARVSMDPLRVFADAEEGRKYALGFCILVAGCDPRSEEGISLSEAVAEAADSPARSLPLAIEILRRMAGEGVPGAGLALRNMDTFARRPRSGRWLGAVGFDIARPPLSMQADGILFAAPGLNLPTKDALLSPVLSRQLLPEQYQAQALVYLAAVVMKAFIVTDPDRFAVGVIDEAWALLSNAQGRELAKDGVRDGRKNFGALWFGSQHARDLGDDELADLIAYRFVFAQGIGAGAEALRWVGVEVTEDNVRLLEEGIQRKDVPGKPPTPARCLVRDPANRIGLVAVLPDEPEAAAAFETNPLRMLRPGTNGQAGAALEPVQ